MIPALQTRTEPSGPPFPPRAQPPPPGRAPVAAPSRNALGADAAGIWARCADRTAAAEKPGKQELAGRPRPTIAARDKLHARPAVGTVVGLTEQLYAGDARRGGDIRRKAVDPERCDGRRKHIDAAGDAIGLVARRRPARPA